MSNAHIEQDNAGVIAPPPLMFLVPLIIGLRLDRRFPLPFLPRALSRIPGLALTGSAIGINSWFLRTMMRARTPVNPTKPTQVIINSGPFRFSRNPSYLSFIMFYTGIAALKNTLWPMLFLPLVVIAVQRGVIEREERYLERKFGEEYLQYKTRVRRWV